MDMALLPCCTDARMPNDRELGKCTICNSDFGHAKRGSDSRSRFLNWHESTDFPRDANNQLVAREHFVKEGFNSTSIASVIMSQHTPLLGAGGKGRELDANEFARMSCIHGSMRKRFGSGAF